MSGEPANFTLQDAARWRATRAARSGGKSPRTAGESPHRPTLGELQRTSSWWWIHWGRCPHFAAMAFAAPVILWGADAPGDVLRQCARSRPAATRARAFSIQAGAAARLALCRFRLLVDLAVSGLPRTQRSSSFFVAVFNVKTQQAARASCTFAE
jgi:hypothetical protein